MVTSIFTIVRNTLVDPLRGKASLVVVLFYNTLSATRKVLRRRLSIVEKTALGYCIPRRGLTKYSIVRILQEFSRTVVILLL